MKNLIVLLAMLSAVHANASTQLLSDMDAPSAVEYVEYTTVIQELRLVPVNAGINPRAFAYQLEADVILGSNPCQAQGTTVELVEALKDGVLEISAVKKVPVNLEERICTREYLPVVQTLKSEIRGFAGDIEAIVVKNVETAGVDFTIVVK
ncbi:MAG: hypothetical protein M3Q07_04900 [Pseudobdellovibrionaceae bacterium]|nr:hypothetical protein [Pseudobdellovibrionaceae bacterium]